MTAVTLTSPTWETGDITISSGNTGLRLLVTESASLQYRITADSTTSQWISLEINAVHILEGLADGDVIRVRVDPSAKKPLNTFKLVHTQI